MQEKPWCEVTVGNSAKMALLEVKIKCLSSEKRTMQYNGEHVCEIIQTVLKCLLTEGKHFHTLLKSIFDKIK